MARQLLIKVYSHRGEKIHVLFDVYGTISIKNGERQRREAENSEFHIAGPDQKPRQSGAQLTRNGNFKDAFARFLMVEWRTDHYFSILGRKEVFLSHGGYCIQLSADVNENVVVFEPIHLQGKHEEADTLIGFHMVNMMVISWFVHLTPMSW